MRGMTPEQLLLDEQKLKHHDKKYLSYFKRTKHALFTQPDAEDQNKITIMPKYYPEKNRIKSRLTLRNQLKSKGSKGDSSRNLKTFQRVLIAKQRIEQEDSAQYRLIDGFSHETRSSLQRLSNEARSRSGSRSRSRGNMERSSVEEQIE